jgi:hypothetical protein
VDEPVIAEGDRVQIFERYLDLRPLRGRSRGLVRCVFHHPDRRGSLSVDLDRGLFNCFTCGAQGGVNRFAALVGEPGARAVPPRRPTRARLELEDSWHGVSLWPLADVVRQRWRAAQALRAHATRLGPAAPGVWLLLAHAARFDRESGLAEVALDAILAEGRLA